MEKSFIESLPVSLLFLCFQLVNALKMVPSLEVNVVDYKYK